MLPACLISFFTLACSPQPREDRPPEPRCVRVGLVTPDGDEGDHLARTIAAEGLKRGYEVLQAPPDIRRQGQQQACAWLLEHDVKGLIARPAAESGWDATLTTARREGVPLLVIGAPLLSPVRPDGEAPSSFTDVVRILPDFTQQGRAAGTWLLRNLPKGAGIIELRGIGGDTRTLERQGGFTGELASTRSLRLAATIAAGPEQASKFNEALTRTNGSVAAVFAHDAHAAKLAVETLDASPDPRASSIKLVWISEADDGSDALSDVEGASIENVPPTELALFDALDRWKLGVRLPTSIQLRTVVIERRRTSPKAPPSPDSPKPAAPSDAK